MQFAPNGPGTPLVAQALTQHALAPGSGEASVDSAHAKAISYWQGLQANHASELNVQETAAVADVIQHLQGRQTYLRNPVGNYKPQDR